MGCTLSSECDTRATAFKSRLERVSSERLAAARREREHVKRDAVVALFDRRDRARAATVTTSGDHEVAVHQGESGAVTIVPTLASDRRSAGFTAPGDGVDTQRTPVDHPASQASSATSAVLDVWRGSRTFTVVHARGSRYSRSPADGPPRSNPLSVTGVAAIPEAP
uniref:Uncharacterized protein n=1 Tax=Neobodo designis TaxID=312471 RepID=A0A7S1LES0_NEODS